VSNRETDREITGSTAPDALPELLSHGRRRRVLACLRENGALPLPDLADEIARRERDAPLPRVPETEELRVFLSVSRVHVPKLADADVVSYDRDRGVVALAEDGDVVDSRLPRESTTGAK